MLPSSSSTAVWMDGHEDEEAVSWPPRSHNPTDNDVMDASLTSFKSMLDTDCFINAAHAPNPSPFYYPDFTTLFFNPFDSSSSCSPSHPFPSHHLPTFLPPKSVFPSLFTNHFDNGFDSRCDPGFFPAPDAASLPILMGFNSQFQPVSEFPAASRMLSFPDDNAAAIGGAFNFEDSDAGGGLYPDTSKLLRPLEVRTPVGTQPTLFQKRAALRQSSRLQNLGTMSSRSDEVLTSVDDPGGMELGRKRKRNCEDEMEDLGGDISAINYDSDDPTDKFGDGNGGDNSNANSSVTAGDQKGKKKKGMPAKNLMAERRRRKKLNDRLYMLRSVVPKISKMDRASILGDSIDYLKELLQRINDLHNELEATPSGSLMHQTTSFHPLTPIPQTLPYRVKEEICASSAPSPKNQSARVEVRLREGRAVNIHMLCARRPGLLLSTMKALDNLGLDIQQAVISCFNGFALDVFRAEMGDEQVREGEGEGEGDGDGQEVLPEQIKAVLLESAGFHGVM